MKDLAVNPTKLAESLHCYLYALSNFEEVLLQFCIFLVKMPKRLEPTMNLS